MAPSSFDPPSAPLPLSTPESSLAGAGTNGDRCTSKSKRSGPPKTDISLPVLAAKGGAPRKHASNAWQNANPKIAHSRVGIWRAIVLIVVHILMAAHIAHWMITGMTVSPVEPSESMQTLREGAVNAGFVFFVLALASTAIFGRYFCGWACHVVALQDLSAWAMMKIGVKPKPFRSRLMIYMPLALAIYMFVWPVFHREVIRPLFADQYGRLPTWLGQSDPLPGVYAEFFVTDFWATFPPLIVAIPFVLVIGFAIVYFLGAKGFCTYGCPYGGFFAPLDLVAPGKIRVDENCNHCGHCTAVCTSNVRVHEEVRDHGMVVDPGCMKCMDCVSVCPNDALRFGMGVPTLLARFRANPNPDRNNPAKSEAARAVKARAKASREARFDMTRREEWAIALVFVAMFLALRGFLNAVPMLMAVAIAAIGAFLVHKAYRCIADPSVRLQHLQLKLKGKLRPAGLIFCLLAVAMVVASVWSGYVRLHVFAANELYAKTTTPLRIALRDDYAPAPAELSRTLAAIRHYERGDAISRGGHGWPLSADERVRLAHLYAVAGNPRQSATILREMVDAPVPAPRDALVFQLADVLRATGQAGENDAQIVALFRNALAKHPNLDQVRAQLVARELGSAERQKSIDGWASPLAEKVVRSSTLFGAASTHALLGENDKAIALVDRAATEYPKSPDDLLTAATMLAALGRPERATELVEQAVAIPTNRGGVKASAAGFYLQLSNAGRATALADEAARAAEKLGPHSGRSSTLQAAARVLLTAGNRAAALANYRAAADAAGNNPWELQSLAINVAQMAVEASDAELLTFARNTLKRARVLQPDSATILHDLAQVSYAAGDGNAAADEMRQAAELGAANPVLAQRCSELMNELGRTDEARKWAAEAARRRQAADAMAEPK